MRIYVLILLFSIGNRIAVFPHDYDTLPGKPDYNQKNQQAQLLLTCSKTHWYHNWDSALTDAMQSLELSQHNADTRGMAEAYRYIGVVNMFKSREKIAGPYFDTALNLFRKIHDSAGLAASYNNIGVLLSHDLSKHRESNFAFREAIHLFQKLKNKEGLGSAINYLGLNYQAQGNFQQAIEYLLQGLEVRKEIGDKPGMMFSMARVGDIYQILKQSDTALKYYNAALRFTNENTTSAHADINGRIANLYMESKQYAAAKKYIDVALKNDSEWFRLLLARYYFETGLTEKALTIYKQVLARNKNSSDYALSGTSLLGISGVHESDKNYNVAIRYATSAFDVANNHTIRWIISDAANRLSSLYAKQGDYQKAYLYEKIHRSIADSSSAADAHIKLGFLESKNEILRKQSNIELLNEKIQIKEQRLQSENLEKKIVIAGISLVVLISIILFRYILLKRKNERHLRELAENELQIQKLESERRTVSFLQQATELEMRLLRAQMNPHFIFNCLSSINRFILTNKTDEASNYLTKFSRLIRMALHNSEKQVITLESELEALRLYLDLERLRFKNAFNYSISFINTIDINAIYIPPMLIQPFAENAIWHGLLHKKGVGSLDIHLCAEDKRVTCTIVDNGIGRKMAASLNSRTAEKTKSMGVEITVGRLALLNKSKTLSAVYNIEDLRDEAGKDCGTKVTLTLPYKDLTEVYEQKIPE